VPSFILIHPTIWPQYTNVTDRQDRTGQTGVIVILVTLIVSTLTMWRCASM